MIRNVRLAILALAIPLGACEEQFDPLIIDGIYSINGYLDAAADTQWVRVTPIRASILTTPDPVDAEVRLEHLGTGRVVQMTQAVFTFPSPNFVGAAAYAHNFWTTEPIERGASYRLTAIRSDGESASATVRIPGGLIEAPVTATGGGSLDSVRVYLDLPEGDHLAILGLAQFLPAPHPCGPSNRPYDLTLLPFQGTRPAGPIAYQSPGLRRTVELPDESCAGREPPETYVGWELWIGYSGERWPYSPGDAIGYLSQASNIQNGRGYLGGIALEKIPLPFCVPSVPSRCEFFFGPESATLDVTIVADGLPVEYPTSVRLRRGEEAWTRSSDHVVLSSPTGQPGFPASPPWQKVIWNAPPTIARFPGLEPDVYRVEVGATTSEYCEERSIVLAPGEHRSIEVIRVNRFQFPNEPVNARGCREG